MTSGILILFVTVGLVGGLVGGMLGVGGGILFVPCLKFGFEMMGVSTDIAMKVAVATSLAIILIAALSAALGHSLHGAIDVRAVFLMSCMAIPAALVGSKIGDIVGGMVLQRVFGITALFVSIQFLRPVPANHQKRDRDITPSSLIMVGGVSGLVSSILGVGGGILTVPLLHLVLDMPMNQAVANSSGLIVFTAVSGTFGWMLSGWGADGRPAYSLGYVNMVAWILIATAAMIAAQVGAWLADKLEPNRLRFPFGVLLGLVGVRMLFF
jgi:uncharacterized protein